MGAHWVIAALAAAWSLPFGAAPAAAGDVVLRATPEGIERLERLAPALPTQVAFPPGVHQVSECSRGGTLEIHRGEVGLQWRDASIAIDGDRLAVEAVVDVDATADVDANRIACFISASGCEISLRARGVTLATRLDIAATEGGALALTPEDLYLDTGAIEGFELDVEGCFLGEVAESLVDLLGTWALDWFGDGFSGVASVGLAALVSDLPLTIPERLTFGAYTVASRFASVEISDESGVIIAANAGLETESGPAPTASAPPIPAPTEPALGGRGVAAFQLAASDVLASHALREAWWDGAFSKLLSEASPSFRVSSGQLVRRLGLIPGTTVEVGIDVHEQPRVEFGRSGEDELDIYLPDISVLFSIQAPGQPAGEVSVRTGARVLGGFRIAPGGALILDARAMEIDRLSVDSGAMVLDTDPARLEQLIADVVLPLFEDSLASVPLAPAITPLPNLYVWLRHVNASGGWLRASFDLFSADPDDRTPPDTTLEERELVRAGLISLAVDGLDDSTPPPLLRYRVLLDGQPLRSEPYFAEHVRFALIDGHHVLEVAAVDLTGNVDPEPARIELEVDGELPRLSVISHPTSLMPRGPITASWVASDDRDGVFTRWQVFELDDGGGPGRVVAEGEAGVTGEAEIRELPAHQLYVLRVIAEDRAGNLSSQEFGFGFEQGGCSAAGGTSWPFPLLLAILFLAAFARRRHTAVAACILAVGAVLASAAPAAAQTGVGSYFSSPVDADGAAPFWNPAAMAFDRGTGLDLGLGLPYVRMTYDNPETQGSSRTTLMAPQPFAGAMTDFGSERFRFGMSVGVPYAIGARWSKQDPESGVTRYFANDAYILHGLVTTSGGYRLSDEVSIGAGVHLSYSYLNAEFDKDFSGVLNGALGVDYGSGPFNAGDPALAAPVEMRSTGIGIGGLIGLGVDLGRVRIGASLHSPVQATTRGSVEASYPDTMREFVQSAAPGAELPELSGNVAMKLGVPLAAFAAVAIDVHPAWELALDYRYADTSSGSRIDVLISESTSPDLDDTEVVKGTRDRHSAGARLIHRLLAGRALAALRARYENNTVFEVATTPNNADFHKLELGAALRWRLSQRMHLTGMFTHYVLFDQRVDQSLHRPTTLPSLDAYNHPRPVGTYSAGADVLTFLFGVRY